ncbi:hypothetical protein [Clostridium botulinum]|uniref:hypothetical protein n=1 Tax=Clostridium botulinum TaxID=1491 RepID=UPI00196880DB|nr:hypothetical protein [Clostridium botulinum]MBN1050302.1 hypothetical protein [Clostridium botulinum]
MEIIMSHNQYLDWKNNYKNTLDIKLENLGIKNSKKLKKQLIAGFGATLFLMNNPIYVFAVDLGAVDNLGNTFLSIIQRVGYWIALLSALAEIVKTAMRGGNNTAEVGKIIMKYLLIYASLYLMPWLFGLVREAF